KTSIFSHPVYLFLRKFSLQDSRGGSNLESQQLTSMLSIQQQRDRYMARQLLSAPVPSLLIAGGYHASKSMGVPLHMEDLATGTHPVVLMLAEKGMNITVDHADYVWFVAPDTTKR
ncbi:ChaN family lipoprotein, partial [Escherichia coli]|uniref:ChaN family lipoprotein n=1 Tax=Escherichia coli TaxID=562 RepID=UPI002036F3DB